MNFSSLQRQIKIYERHQGGDGSKTDALSRMAKIGGGINNNDHKNDDEWNLSVMWHRNDNEKNEQE